jgi:hypothetical protein
MADLVTAKTFQTRTEAELAKSFLENHEIQSWVMADDNGGMDPYPMQNVFGVFLKVSERDLEKAKDLLK